MFGVRQSGMMDFHIADVYKDSEILRQTSLAAQELLAQDPGLEQPEHRRLRKKIQEAFAEKNVVF